MGEIQYGKEIEGGYVSKVFASSLDECAPWLTRHFFHAWRVEGEPSSSAAGWR